MSTAEVPPRLRFVGPEELAGAAHVLVDGAARPGTELVLSHWPSTPAPAALWRDLSTEMAFAYLDAGCQPALDCELVTGDHVDEDGIASLYVLTDPEGATARRHDVVAFARAGDFGVVTDPEAARQVFAFNAVLDSLAVAGCAGGAFGDMTAIGPVGAALLARLPEILDTPDHFAAGFAAEEAWYRSSAAALAGGGATVAEDEALGLAVVVIGPGLEVAPRRRAAPSRLHPLVLHSATALPRLVVVDGSRFVYYDRYETWVRFVSRPLPLRVDLAPLAAVLSEMEPGGVAWSAGSPGAISPRLEPEDDAASQLSLEVVLEALRRHLAEAPPAWDPYRAEGPLVPGVSAPAVARSGTSGRGRARWRHRWRARPSA